MGSSGSNWHPIALARVRVHFLGEKTALVRVRVVLPPKTNRSYSCVRNCKHLYCARVRACVHYALAGALRSYACVRKCEHSHCARTRARGVIHSSYACERCWCGKSVARTRASASGSGGKNTSLVRVRAHSACDRIVLVRVRAKLEGVILRSYAYERTWGRNISLVRVRAARLRIYGSKLGAVRISSQ